MILLSIGVTHAATALDGQLLEPQGRAQREQQVTYSANRLRDQLHDPDSLIIEHVFTTRDAKIVCIAYRVKNGFGGVDRDTIAFADGETIWRAHSAAAKP